MDVGELFVNLGVKGSDKSVAAVSGVKDAMGAAASEGLAAKAAIVGVIYALERMFETSSKRGAGLENFSALLGVSTDTVQRYQWAAQQVNVANADVEASFASLQQAMGKTLMGQGAPAGMAQVAKLTGAISPEDVAKWAKSPELLIKRLQDYAGRETNAWLRNEVLKSFGLNAGMIEALSRQAFKDDILAKAPTLSEGQIKQLDHVSAQLANLKQKVMMSFEGFTASHGSQLVHDIDAVTTGVIAMVTALIDLGDKLHVFDTLGEIASATAELLKWTGNLPEKMAKQGQTNPFMPSVSDVKKAGAEAVNSGAGHALLEGFMGFLKGHMAGGIPGAAATPTKAALPSSGAVGGHPSPNTGGSAPSGLVVPPSPLLPSAAAAARPSVTPLLPPPAAPTQEINVQQTLQFQHDGKDAVKTADSVKSAVQKTYRQMYAQVQVV